MRIIAALIAFCCCTLEGRRRSLVLKKRVKLLTEILLMLGNFSIEIRCRALTLDELLKSEEGEFARLVTLEKQRGCDIKTAWENACRQLPKNAERTLLSELGRSFGTSDRAGELQLLEMYSEQLSRLKNEAELSYSQKGKALSRVGTLCGIAAAILII